MDVNNITNVASAYSLQTRFSKGEAVDGREADKPKGPSFDETAVVYERSAGDYPGAVKPEGVLPEDAAKYPGMVDKTATDEEDAAAAAGVLASESTEEAEEAAETEVDRSELVRQLQNEAEARAQKIIDMVRETLGMQVDHSKSIGELLGEAVDKAGGVENEEASAVEDSDDDYWGSEQTARRIVDFAIALSGGDTNYADQLLEAFKKGYSDAESSLGGNLPQVCKNTYDKVVSYFDDWKNGTYMSGTDA